MQESTLEIHTIQDGNLVKVINIEGPKKSDLHSRQGFFVSETGGLAFVGPHKPDFILREGMELSREAFEKKRDFITEKITELHYNKKKVDIPIEREEIKSKDWMFEPGSIFSTQVKKTGPRMKKQRKESTGIQITVYNKSSYPVVTGIRALEKAKLPFAYLKSSLPRVWQDRDALFAGGTPRPLLIVGAAYHPERLLEALKYIQLAGEHLAIINKGINWLSQDDHVFVDGKLKATSKVDK